MTGALRLALLAAVAPLVFAAGTAGAADALPCRPEGQQQAMDDCAVRSFRDADAKLNIRYVAVMEALPADKRMALRTDQREWIRQRDPHCKVQARPSEGGPTWSQVFYKCLEQASADRLEAINGWESHK